MPACIAAALTCQHTLYTEMLAVQREHEMLKATISQLMSDSKSLDAFNNSVRGNPETRTED